MPVRAFIEDEHPRDPLTGRWTDKAVGELAARAVELEHPVRVQPKDAVKSAWSGQRVYAMYKGFQGGKHVVHIDRNLRGVVRVTAVAHEVAHARQQELLGTARFRKLYRRLYRKHGEGPGHPMEEQARRTARTVLNHIAELEGRR